MRITVLTETALTGLASGARMNYAGSDLFQRISQQGDIAVHAIYHVGDTENDSRIVIFNQSSSDLLPSALCEHRTAAMHRILSFFQRTRSLPVSLPRAWRQYKHDNRMAFFAIPTVGEDAPRWVTEVRPRAEGDVVFWDLTTSADKRSLAEFTVDEALYARAVSTWSEYLVESIAALKGPSQEAVNVEVDLTLDASPAAQSLAKARTYSQWLGDLTKCQLQFVEALADRSLRLRGPAGSGKTLTMALKAVREVQAARQEGRDIRLLFVTHSWSLAGEVDDIIQSLSESGRLDEITVLPLVAVAQQILPIGMVAEGLELIGDDSYTSKSLQLAQIEEVIAEFRAGDWITYRGNTSEEFKSRIESDSRADQRGLAWDCLVEFGCVLGADGIFPGFNAEQRYLRLPRAPWMMDLEVDGDKKAVYALYESYWESMQARRLITSDQLLNDFLNYLETFAWNHRRTNEGYDLIFADEFHLFNVQERQTLRYLSREVSSYPKIFMALDPRQSPWEAFVGADASNVSDSSAGGELDNVETVDIPTVHRLSPQVLDLVKHIHLEFPNLDLGSDWEFSISEVESMAQPGPTPALFVSDTQEDEEIAIYSALSETYPRAHAGAQLALAIVDEDRFAKYMTLMERVSQSGKYRVVPITSRDDVGLLKSHRRGVVVGPAEYLAGLQFDTVLVAGLPDMSSTLANQSYRRRRALSLLYLAVTRASREVRLFTNHDAGGVPEVLSKARKVGVLGMF